MKWTVRYIIVSACLLWITSDSFAQDGKSLQDIDSVTVISKEMQNQKESPNIPLPLEISKERLQQEDPNKMLVLLKPYLDKNEPNNVRQRAMVYLAQTADLHPRPGIRQQVAELLTFNLTDPDLRTFCYLELKEYVSSDFNQQSRDYIRKQLDATFGSIRYVSLCGIANIQDILPQLGKLTFDEMAYRQQKDPISITVPWYYTLGWQARLARARMGVEEDIQKCVRLIKEEIDGNPQFSLSLFNDLGYIRQPQSIELLKKYFLSDRNLRPCDGYIESFTSYVLPIISDNLPDFPKPKSLEWNSRSFTEEEIGRCKKWLSEQKEWKIRR